jgi:hypothetical protein
MAFVHLIDRRQASESRFRKGMIMVPHRRITDSGTESAFDQRRTIDHPFRWMPSAG